ncbi:integrase family protein [Aurantimonas sp. 22II-16-19i]|nr:integrase family protein [Aurantimonas sp. 22II-16-19i]
MPKDLGGGRGSAPIRISLGACPAREARRMADLLAAESRRRFDEMRNRRLAEEDDRPEDEAFEPEYMFSGSTPGEVWAEMRGWMKAHTSIIRRDPPPPTQAEERRFEGWRGLVGIAREVAKGADGNPLIVDNVEVLKSTYVKKLSGAAIPAAASAQPAREPYEFLKPEEPAAAMPLTDQPSQDPASPRVASMPEPGNDGAAEDQELDEQGRPIPAFKRDRRFVKRSVSRMPMFSDVSEEYLAARAGASGETNKDLKTARFRRDLFIELIGDHPVDTYTPADLQAYISLLTFWPAMQSQRPKDAPAREIIEANRDLHLRPLSRNALQHGYVSIVKTMIGYRSATLGYADPFARAKVWWPKTATPAVSAEPLSAERISAVFRVGAESGLLDNILLPLLGHLTGRRIGLLIHLKGNDIREKYRGVYVAQTSGITLIDGRWSRVPYKTDASTTFFVLHEFLAEIGFVDWAMAQGDAFLFPELMRLADPSKSASSYMGRLFARAGIPKSRKEVFHSLRGGQIEDMRDSKIDSRDRRLQAGHAVAVDEHEGYGFKSITEIRARELAKLPLNPEIDFSVFRGLDFDRLATRKRKAGRQVRDQLE